MTRLLIVLFIGLFTLAACESTLNSLPDSTADGVKVFRINKAQSAKVQFRMLDTVNALRRASGLNEVALSAELTAAAATHSLDMSVQNRPWHFGSDGSTPIDRIVRAGYAGSLIGENISETYENDTETLAAWLSDPLTKESIMNPAARFMGIAWYQEPNGKIWWTQIFGS